MAWSDHPARPAPGTVLCAIAEIPDDGGREVAFGSEREPLRLLLLRQGEHVWGYENVCPHFSLPLNFDPQVFVTLDGLVMCAHHTAFFRFEDGYCVDGPCAGAGLTQVPVHCRDGHVCAGTGFDPESRACAMSR
jgi:nitrite reductase/ring-hydroxylating ferredoxin subunit